MAIDYGAKRVGIASTDETGRFALPRAVWPNDEALLDKILKLKEEEGIEKIIIGESINLDGSSNPIQKEIERFKGMLEKRLTAQAGGVEVVSHPEFLTTREAGRLQGKISMIDASAAALILKSFIDTMYNEDV